ncbi:RraA family protein [Agromyces archimandritae]|uniref:Putative 4-hydroxy-4-methyl-2-oxoglutarate aldolase n=1 Tax=Agromyces archimandritae TaxID=2781962 RepID=A0A975FLP2_9MICO|nr:RraA family protein [Agromyces archimandritae]QTX04405.1 RraA family protein [Agromyces archimandritae]
MSPATPEQILRWGSATLHESCPERRTVLPGAIRPAWPGAQLVGPAYPVKAAPGDNLALHWALLRAAPGDVLVVDAHDADHGHWGEVMAVQALAKGLAGLVVWGGVRDTAQQHSLGFPVFSSRISPRGTAKEWAGTQGAPIRIGDVDIAQGDLIVADADGVVAIPGDLVPVTLERAAERERKEAAIMADLRAGSATLDVYGLRGLDAPFGD